MKRISEICLEEGTVGSFDSIQKEWLQYNIQKGKGVKLARIVDPRKLNTKSSTFTYRSICACAPVIKFTNNNICKAHIYLSGEEENKCKIISIDLQHTCGDNDVG